MIEHSSKNKPVLVGQWLISLDCQRVHLQQGGDGEEFIPHAVVQEGPDRAGQVVLILAGKLPAAQGNEEAPQVMDGQLLERFDALFVAPADKKAEFQAVKLARCHRQTPRFAVQQEEIESIDQQVSS